MSLEDGGLRPHSLLLDLADLLLTLEEQRFWVVCSSFRVPDDSDSKSGVIRQRQKCLESQMVEGQQLPVLTLAPCAGKQEVGAFNQVRRPRENRQLALASATTDT